MSLLRMLGSVLVLSSLTVGVASAAPMTIPPVTVTQVAAGVPVKIVLYPTLDVQTQSDHADISITIKADLTDFQNRLQTIVSALPMKSSKCADRWSVGKTTAAGTGTVAVINVSGKGEYWTCTPSATCIGYAVIDLGFRKIKTCTQWKKDEAAQFVVSQSFDGILSIGLSVQDQTKITPAVTVKSVQLDGTVAHLTQDLLQSVFNLNIRDKVQDIVSQQLSAGTFQVAIPPALNPYHVVFTQAAFEDRGAGKLGVVISAAASIPASELANVLQQLPQTQAIKQK